MKINLKDYSVEEITEAINKLENKKVQEVFTLFSNNKLKLLFGGLKGEKLELAKKALALEEEIEKTNEIKQESKNNEIIKEIEKSKILIKVLTKKFRLTENIETIEQIQNVMKNINLLITQLDLQDLKNNNYIAELLKFNTVDNIINSRTKSINEYSKTAEKNIIAYKEESLKNEIKVSKTMHNLCTQKLIEKVCSDEIEKLKENKNKDIESLNLMKKLLESEDINKETITKNNYNSSVDEPFYLEIDYINSLIEYNNLNNNNNKNTENDLLLERREELFNQIKKHNTDLLNAIQEDKTKNDKELSSQILLNTISEIKFNLKQKKISKNKHYQIKNKCCIEIENDDKKIDDVNILYASANSLYSSIITSEKESEFKKQDSNKIEKIVDKMIEEYKNKLKGLKKINLIKKFMIKNKFVKQFKSLKNSKLIEELNIMEKLEEAEECFIIKTKEKELKIKENK